MKLHITLPKGDKITPIVIVLFLTALFSYSVFFLYKNFYITLAQVEHIELLERNVSREKLNRKLWDKALQGRIEKLKEEEGPLSPSSIRDPFGNL